MVLFLAVFCEKVFKSLRTTEIACVHCGTEALIVSHTRCNIPVCSSKKKKPDNKPPKQKNPPKPPTNKTNSQLNWIEIERGGRIWKMVYGLGWAIISLSKAFSNWGLESSAGPKERRIAKVTGCRIIQILYYNLVGNQEGWQNSVWNG